MRTILHFNPRQNNFVATVAMSTIIEDILNSPHSIHKEGSETTRTSSSMRGFSSSSSSTSRTSSGSASSIFPSRFSSTSMFCLRSFTVTVTIDPAVIVGSSSSMTAGKMTMHEKINRIVDILHHYSGSRSFIFSLTHLLIPLRRDRWQ